MQPPPQIDQIAQIVGIAAQNVKKCSSQTEFWVQSNIKIQRQHECGSWIVPQKEVSICIESVSDWSSTPCYYRLSSTCIVFDPDHQIQDQSIMALTILTICASKRVRTANCRQCKTNPVFTPEGSSFLLLNSKPFPSNKFDKMNKGATSEEE